MSDAGTQARLENERDFHNARFAERAEDPRGHLDKFYDAVGDAFAAHAAILRERGRGADVLEYGCADGSLALEELRVPGFAKSFHGIDISDAAIDRARERAAALGFANARFDRMNAEAMDFPDACFDVVYGRGIIHHLRLDAAFPEIARVLRPGGLALFAEPLGHNPVLNWYRNRTPELRTADEHPLVRDDFALARRHFTKVEASFHGLMTLAAVPLRRSASAPSPSAPSAASTACSCPCRGSAGRPGTRCSGWSAKAVAGRRRVGARRPRPAPAGGRDRVAHRASTRNPSVFAAHRAADSGGERVARAVAASGGGGGQQEQQCQMSHHGRALPPPHRSRAMLPPAAPPT